MHSGQGRRQHVHGGIEHGGIHIQCIARAGKLANSTSSHQLVQRGIGLTGNKIQRRGNVGDHDWQRLQRQPRVHTSDGIAGLKRCKQRALSRRKLARAAAARKQHAPAADEHNGRIRQHHGVVSGAQRQRLLQAHLHGTGLAHRHGGLALQKHDATDNLSRAGHHMHARTRLEHTRLGSLTAQVGERHHKA